ncbi:MAG: UMP kinase [Aeropyrum sp.]|nr:UMP kinase [Aeropyrum sp.]MCE4616467.1 UMP kinase [Aeropyrum sp.]
MVGGSEPIVLKISGSLFYPPNPDFIKSVAESVVALTNAGFKPAVVVGGGGLARKYIGVLRELGVSEALLDETGIEASRLNASLLARTLFPRSKPYALASLRDIVETHISGLIPVSGGLHPGQSTNAVAALIAEAIGASIILNGLNRVGGVYRRWPVEDSDASPIERLTYGEFERLILGVTSDEAGGYALWDKVALSIARRSRLTIVFFDASDPRNILRALKGEIGSRVVPEGG